MESRDVERTGHCLCGAVRFRTRGPVRGVIACHCTQCRRQSGHFYAATSVADDCLSIDGEDLLVWFRASPEAARGFCGNCGSILFWKSNGSATTSIGAGAFDDPNGLTFAGHIFCDDKAAYYEIGDDAPNHGQGWPEEPV
jgi:Uncharacterized conserved protein